MKKEKKIGKAVDSEFLPKITMNTEAIRQTRVTGDATKFVPECII